MLLFLEVQLLANYYSGIRTLFSAHVFYLFMNRTAVLLGFLGRFLNRTEFDTERLGLLVSVATLKQNRVWSEQLGLCSLVLVTEQHNLLGLETK